MIACYLDESGDTGPLPSPTSPSLPLLCIIGLTVDLARLRDFTLEFIDLKARFFPKMYQGTTRLGSILHEIKGSDIRAAFRAADYERGRVHHHIGFLDALLDMLVRYDSKIFGRIWVKQIGRTGQGVSMYTFSAQSICVTFNHLLNATDKRGILICDPRGPTQNTSVSHSIFTQKFKALGDAYPRLIEMPTFGNSDNHAGIQVCDLICSGLLFPMASYTYCLSYVQNMHVDVGFKVLKDRYGRVLYDRQYRYTEQGSARRMGGVTVSDPLGRKSGGHLFKEIVTVVRPPEAPLNDTAI